jgi:hypothetical protein
VHGEGGRGREGERDREREFHVIGPTHIPHIHRIMNTNVKFESAFSNKPILNLRKLRTRMTTCPSV